MQPDGTATIDVNTGGCEHFVGKSGGSFVEYSGHCKPSSKLF
jgi:hypothetical protein